MRPMQQTTIKNIILINRRRKESVHVIDLDKSRDSCCIPRSFVSVHTAISEEPQLWHVAYKKPLTGFWTV